LKKAVIVISFQMPREDAMAAPMKIVKTPAEIALAEDFKAVQLGAADPLADRRTDAFHQFERQGLPNRRLEAWHYTDLRALWDEAAPRAHPPAQAYIKNLIRTEQPNKRGRPAPRLFLVDGVYCADLSDTALLPDGVKVGRLTDFAGADRSALEDLFLGDELARSEAVVALNTALLHDTLVIEVAAGTQVQAPLHVLSIIVDRAAHATYPRLIVRLGEGARLTLVENQRAKQAGAHQRNAVTILYVGDRATLTHVSTFSDEHDEALNLCSVIARLGAHSAVDSCAVISAGALVRRQIFLRFDGERARANLRGIALLAKSQHEDTTLVVDHAAPHCTSRELFKHIITDTATGVFQGKVIVRRGAQKTDGGMKSQTLMLSQTATMNNKPELEIFADDVVCGHGATVGQLDRDQLFYLMARGLPLADAEALLLEAFAAEATENISDEHVSESLNDIIRNWLRGRAS
jgi:Fe-S cluster assembly protein SufD